MLGCVLRECYRYASLEVGADLSERRDSPQSVCEWRVARDERERQRAVRVAGELWGHCVERQCVRATLTMIK